jgi:hypothetical protein
MVRAQPKRVMQALVGAGVFAMAEVVAAHHSFAACDQDKTASLKGTVKEAGQSADYLIAGAAVSTLIQSGWRKTTLLTGDIFAIVVELQDDPCRSGGAA